MNSSRIHLALCLLVVASTAMADGARRSLDRFTQGLTALEGRFEQHVFNTDGSLREEADGAVALKSPRQFRWQYETPYEQIIVADGTHVWLYDVDLEQVTVKQQADQEAQSPLVVLTDPASLDQRYRVSEAGRREGLDWLRLEPNGEEGEFRSAELGLSADGLVRMDLEDNLGGRTEIRFDDWRRNPVLAADRFRFTLPADVEVIGDVDSVGEVRPLEDDR